MSSGAPAHGLPAEYHENWCANNLARWMEEQNRESSTYVAPTVRDFSWEGMRETVVLPTVGHLFTHHGFSFRDVEIVARADRPDRPILRIFLPADAAPRGWRWWPLINDLLNTAWPYVQGRMGVVVEW